MVLPAHLPVAAAAGFGAFAINMLIYRNWPPSLGDLVGPVVLGIATGVGVYIAFRILARRNTP